MWECKTRASVLVGAALFAGVSSAGAEPPRLDLVWVDPTGMVEGTYPVVSAESSHALAAIGADVRWMAAPPQGAVVGPEALVVIAVPTYKNTSGARNHVMGSTRAVSDGALAVWVFPDQVAWALGLDLGRRPSWGKQAEGHFARAMARVASHEILHALGAAEHTRGGLMAERLDRKALTSAAVPRVDREVVSTVRRAFDRGALRAAGAWTPPRLFPAPLTAVVEPSAAYGSAH
jgi:hypothetical protein